MPSLPRFGLDDKVVVVTGAGRGIGRVIARDASASGARLAVGSRTPSELESLASEIEATGGQCFHHVLDVTDIASITRFMDAVIAHYGRIDVLINNAGFNQAGRLLDLDEALYQRIVDANLKSAMFCSQAAARHMIRQGDGGAIVNISSQASVIGAPDRGIYSGAKAGVNNLSRRMAAEWAEFGIRVNVVAPTVTRTALAETILSTNAEFAESVRRNNLLRRGLAEPEEISAPVIFLASNAASMITGQILARISHTPSAADAERRAVTDRTRSARLDILSSMPSSLFTACGPSQRGFHALATKACEKSGLVVDGGWTMV